MSENTSTDQSELEVVTQVAAVSDGARTLIVADFSDTETAWQAYESLRSIEDGRHLAIDGVVVVTRDAEGTLEVQTATDHSTKRGMTWGLVGGAALGIFFPPSILGTAAVLGASGAAIGKARQLHHKSEIADRLAVAVAPGHSGIVAIVSDPGILEIRAALRTANAVVESALDDVAAKDITAMAKDAEKAEKAEKE